MFADSDRSNIPWISFQESFKINTIENKLFVMVCESTSELCFKYKETLEVNPIIGRFINDNYIPVYINQDKDFIPVQLISKDIPSFWITDFLGEPLEPAINAKNPKRLQTF